MNRLKSINLFALYLYASLIIMPEAVNRYVMIEFLTGWWFPLTFLLCDALIYISNPSDRKNLQKLETERLIFAGALRSRDFMFGGNSHRLIKMLVPWWWSITRWVLICLATLLWMYGWTGWWQSSAFNNRFAAMACADMDWPIKLLPGSRLSWYRNLTETVV